MRKVMILAGALAVLAMPVMAQPATSTVGSALGVGMQAAPAAEPMIEMDTESGMDHSMGHGPVGVSASIISVPVTAVAPVAASTKAYAEASARMHAGMGIAYSGDADVDFVKGMIPHHQGAIDMAKVVIAHGSDPDLRMMANEIIKAQSSEIETMRKWLALHGPKDPNAVAPVVKSSKPRPPAMKATTKVEPKPMGDLLDEVTAPVAASTTAPVAAAPVAVSGSVATEVSNSAAAPAMSETVTAAPATEAKLIEDDEMPMPLLEDMLIPTGTEPAPANAQ